MGNDTRTTETATGRGSPLEERAWTIRDAEGIPYGTHHRVGDGEQKDVWWTGHEGSVMSPKEFPFYGSEHANEWDPNEPVILVEGEKARDSLDATGVFAVLGTLGTSHLPADRFFEVLRGREVIGWADGDDKGREHMDKVLAKAARYAAMVRDYTWHGAPEGIKAPDAADHPAVISRDAKGLDRLLNDLLSARRWEPKMPETFPRIKLGEMLAGGLEPTPQLHEGMIYEGRIHSIASGAGTGKTRLALYISKEEIRQGKKVAYFDAENGPKVMAERMGELGATPEELDEGFYYYPAEVTLDRESLALMKATMEEVRPDLAVFDSFADMLAMAGLEENSNSDCTLWMGKVAQPLKDAGIAVLVLDHVPKSGNGGPRGASSKVAKVDVQWNLDVTLHYDRNRCGEITLKHSKDREGWLPKIVRFSVGNGVFARSEGTVERPEADGLTDSQRTALSTLASFGTNGATFTQWRDATGQAQGTFAKARNHLLGNGQVEQRGQRYFAGVHLEVHPQLGVESTPDSTPEDGGETRNGVGMPENLSTPAPGVLDVYSGVRPEERVHRTTHGFSHVVVYSGDAEGEGVPDSTLSMPAVSEELRRRGSGPRKNMPHYLSGKTSLEILTKSVLAARNMDPGAWAIHAPAVEEAAKDPGNHPIECQCEGCL